MLHMSIPDIEPVVNMAIQTNITHIKKKSHTWYHTQIPGRFSFNSYFNSINFISFN